MKKRHPPVAGVRVAPPKVTPLGAFLFATAVALPVGAILTLADWWLS